MTIEEFFEKYKIKEVKPQNNLLLQTLIELVKKNGCVHHIFDLKLEECYYLYSFGIKVKKIENSIFPIHYELTLEK